MCGLEMMHSKKDRRLNESFWLDVNRMAKVRNECIRGTAQSSLEARLERYAWDNLDMCRGGTMDVLDKGFEDGVARQEEKRKQQKRLLDALKEGMQRLVWLTKIRGGRWSTVGGAERKIRCYLLESFIPSYGVVDVLSSFCIRVNLCFNIVWPTQQNSAVRTAAICSKEIWPAQQLPPYSKTSGKDWKSESIPYIMFTPVFINHWKNMLAQFSYIQITINSTWCDWLWLCDRSYLLVIVVSLVVVMEQYSMFTFNVRLKLN